MNSKHFQLNYKISMYRGFMDHAHTILPPHHQEVPVSPTVHAVHYLFAVRPGKKLRVSLGWHIIIFFRGACSGVSEVSLQSWEIYKSVHHNLLEN